jgi:L-aspartate oxidase
MAIDESADLIVVGAGIAGLSAALTAAAAGGRVLVVSKAPLANSSSYWAQGGIAAALAKDDAPALHIDDTITSGRDLCVRSAVELLAAEAPGQIDRLAALAVRFDQDLGREGGHGRGGIAKVGGA